MAAQNAALAAKRSPSFATRTLRVRIATTPSKILSANPNRDSYYIINQHAAQAIYVASGSSNGPHVATVGNHMGERVGPNGGTVYDDSDLDEVWGVATAVNNEVLIIEKIRSGRLTR